MENYILILLTILVTLVIAIVYFGYRQLNHIRTTTNKNTMNISGIQSYLSKMIPSEAMVNERSMPINGNQYVNIRNMPELDSEDEEISSVDNINVSDSEDCFAPTHNDYIPNSEDLLKDQEVVITDHVDQENDNLIGHITEPIIEPIIEPNMEGLVVDSAIEDNEEDNEEDIDNDTKVIELKSNKKTVRLSPNDSPKKFEIGHEQLSENDNKVYEVIENKIGTKRWKLKR